MWVAYIGIGVAGLLFFGFIFVMVLAGNVVTKGLA